MQKAIKLLKLAVVGLIIPVVFLVAAYNGQFKIQHLNIQSRLPSRGLEAKVYENYIQSLRQRLSKYQGEDLWALDIKRLQSIILSEKWIESASVYRKFPATLQIDITTKQAVAIVYSKSNKLFLVACDGELLPEIEATKAPSLPVIQQEQAIRDHSLRLRMARILCELPVQGTLSLTTIAELNLDSQKQLWLHHMPTHSQIKLGEQNISLKSARVSQVLDYLAQNSLSSRVIDADFSKKVLVRLRNDR